MPNQRVTATQKRSIFERAKGRCEYCQSPAHFATQSFVAEHIQPRSAGGETTLENLALSCSGCNSHKYNKIQALDPETNQYGVHFSYWARMAGGGWSKPRLGINCQTSMDRVKMKEH